MLLIVLIWQTLTEPRPFACGYVRYQEHRGREHISTWALVKVQKKYKKLALT